MIGVDAAHRLDDVALGHAVDYAVNRPIYMVTGAFPYVFGYTGEDNMQNSQRQ